MNNAQQKPAKKRPRLFQKNSDLKTVCVVTFFFVVVVLIYQIIAGFSTKGGLNYPSFIYPSNLLNIFIQVAAVGTMAMGMCTVMISGGIDLSVGMMVSLVAIFIAKAVMDWYMSPAVAVFLAILICIAIESIMGLIIAWLDVEPFIITLGGMIACKGIALLIAHSQEIAMAQNLAWFKSNVFDWFNSEGVKVFGFKLQLPYYVILFVLIAIATWALLKYTRFGRRVYSVGNNPQAAYLSGINVRMTKLLTYAFNGLCVGIGGTIALVRQNTGIISIGQNMEIDVIAAVVIGGVAMSGGKGNALGAFIGAILMGAITNAMTLMRIQFEWQYLVKGLIIIIAVAGGAFSEILTNKKAIREQSK